jgi:predicted negative regulator of RcsB-dependent stress response
MKQKLIKLKHWFKEYGVELVCFIILLLVFYQICVLIL